VRVLPRAANSDDHDDFFECFLVDGPEEGVVAEAALLFAVMPTGHEGGALPTTVSTVRMQHTTQDGRVMFLTDVPDQKPRFPVARELTAREKAKEAAAPKSRSGFSLKMNGAEVLKIMPLASLEADAISRVASYIPVVQQYAYKFLNGGTLPLFCGHIVHTRYYTQDTLKAMTPI